MQDNKKNHTKKGFIDVNFDTPVQFIKGVGPARAKAFEALGVRCAGDLLEYYPRDWVFVPEVTDIADIYANQAATLGGIVESCDFQQFRRPAIFEAYISDESGMCRIVWFHGGFLRGKLEPGMKIFVSGKVVDYKGQLQMNNPKLIISNEQDQSNNEKQKLGGSVYPACAKLGSRQIKNIINTCLDKLLEGVDEFFDKPFLKKANLIERSKAFRWIHRPKDQQQTAMAMRRLKYDELFLMQTALALRRYKLRHYASATAMKHSDKIDSRIRRRFPFLLTGDQSRAAEEIVADMGKTVPMNRLLQGDVGSGKTVIALYAALLAVANKKQAVIMAPTEILAQQHFLSMERYLKDSQVQRSLIKGGLTGTKRNEALKKIKAGKVDIIVGTVALIQKDIQFKNLGVVVIDEQHKFGVHQRASLRKDNTPHCLVMTATPIPRTLAMTAFGDLDVSVIKQPPPGRGKIITRALGSDDIGKAYEFIRERLRARKQAYFVYPRIADSENGDVKAAISEYEKLSRKIFPEFKVALLHGQMSTEETRKVMDGFRTGKTDCLVSTVLIEVGVDVPNATIMVIEGADRFGLAQLHQLRGRIARSQSNSYCLLFAETQSQLAKQRLAIMERSSNGFEIAEEDLKIRGPGEIFSPRQHGLPDMKIANIIDDFELLTMARKDAFEIVENDPMLKTPEHKNIRAELLKKFGESLGLVDIA